MIQGQFVLWSFLYESTEEAFKKGVLGNLAYVNMRHGDCDS
jgi:hypothetical protein